MTWRVLRRSFRLFLGLLGHTRTTGMTRASTLHLDYCPEIVGMWVLIHNGYHSVGQHAHIKHRPFFSSHDGFIVVEMNSSASSALSGSPFSPLSKGAPRMPLILLSRPFSVSALRATGTTSGHGTKCIMELRQISSGSSFYQDLHYPP